MHAPQICGGLLKKADSRPPVEYIYSPGRATQKQAPVDFLATHAIFNVKFARSKGECTHELELATGKIRHG